MRRDSMRLVGPPQFTLPVPCDPRGIAGPTRGQAQGPGFRRTSRGLYVPSSVERTDLQRAIEAVTNLRDEAILGGWGAAMLWGARYVDGQDRHGEPLPVLVHVGPAGRRTSCPGVLVSHESVPDTEIHTHFAVRTVAPVRACFDLAWRAESLHSAVVAIDMMVGAGLTTLSALTEYAARSAGRRGIGRFRHALAWASDRSLSPGETMMRLMWCEVVSRPPLVNASILNSAGQHVAMVDLLDPATGLVGEYDGEVHRSATQHGNDVVREDNLRALGLEVVRATSRDLRRPRDFAVRLKRALARAQYAPEPARRWTHELR